MQIFKDKVAVITGAGSGIGKALAERCAKESMKVVIADLNLDALKLVENELKQYTSDVISVKTDVSSQSDIEQLAQKTLDTFGQVNLLFNNAGIPGPLGPLWELEVGEIARVMQINWMSVVYGLKVFIPLMLAQKNECHIVNTASISGLVITPDMSAYTSTKHAVVGLTEVLYYDLKQRNVDINVSLLCPAAVKTKFANDLNTQTQDTLTNKAGDFLKANLATGLTPEAVATQTFIAIQEKRFYILTHPEYNDAIKSGMEDILLGRNPSRIG